MGLSGRYWLTPTGETLAVMGGEHANMIKMMLLDLKGRDRVKFAPIAKTFKPLPPEEAEFHLARGIAPEIIEFLTASAAVDPRKWAIEHWGWVRTADGIFNLWVLNDETLETIRKNREYWVGQQHNIDKYTTAQINEEGTGEIHKVRVRAMLDPGSSRESLTALAKGVRYRNPQIRTGDWNVRTE